MVHADVRDIFLGMSCKACNKLKQNFADAALVTPPSCSELQDYAYSSDGMYVMCFIIT